MGGVGLLSGMFGGRPQEDVLTHQNRLLQSNVAQQMYRFGTGVPGSDPGEQAALAQERGQLGAAQRQQQQQVYGAYNPAQGANGLADMMRNLSNNQVGQQMSLQESHLLNALSQRRQALMDAANVGGRAAQTGPVWQPQSDLPQVLGQVAQSIAYQRALGKGQGSATTQGSPGLQNDLGRLGVGTGAPSLPPGYWTGGTPGGSGAVPGSAQPIPGVTSTYTAGSPAAGGTESNPFNWPSAGVPPEVFSQGLGMTPVGDDPMMTQMLQMQGMGGQPAGPGSQPAAAAAGAMAPPAVANQPFGMNSSANQARQAGPGRYVQLPNGLRMAY